MAWKVQTVEKSREEFVIRVLTGEKTKIALCQEYKISRPTGDKWIERYQNGESMSDRSKAPFRTPNRTNEDTEQAIVELRRKRPTMGAKKLKRMLENQGHTAPAHSTINTILHRHGLITKEASAAATPYIRFEKASPNEMWQADFKGHFAMTNGQRCHPLTILDDHSRYSLCIDAKENERHESTAESFIRVFERYGLPLAILCDNGNPWGTAQSVGYTKFEVWLMDLGILVKHGRPHHPQTQGKEERFNGTLYRECIKGVAFEHFPHAQALFDEYRRFYNHERPHHALDLGTPAQRYRESTRKMPQRIDEWEYPPGVIVARVKASGYLTLSGQGYFLSEAFGGKPVGLMDSGDKDGTFFVLYRGFCVAKLNVEQRCVVAKSAFFWDDSDSAYL